MRCDSPEHPLANREFLFPFASVVEVPAEEMPAVLGPTLAVTVITADDALAGASSPRRRAPAEPRPLPTWRVSWDQPHEGNLFEHLYVRRALQGSPGAAQAEVAARGPRPSLYIHSSLPPPLPPPSPAWSSPRCPRACRHARQGRHARRRARSQVVPDGARSARILVDVSLTRSPASPCA